MRAKQSPLLWVLTLWWLLEEEIAKMKMLKQPDYFFLLALFFLSVGLSVLVLADRDGSRNHALKLVASEVVLADTVSDHEKAINRYQLLDRDNSLIKVRIMRRRWLLALSVFQQSQKRREVVSYQDDHLFTLQQSGESLLNQELLPAVAWRVHNLLGASFLLQALEMLEKEQNLQRSRALLNLAIDHFKQAIIWIDKDPAAHAMTNIPRWNLELLSTMKNLSGLAKTRTADDSRLDLKTNLATMLPESAGYMVGEPPDSRIRK